MTNQVLGETLQKKIDQLQINQVRRHIFLCIGESCCSKDEGQKVWDYLKLRLKNQDAAQAGIYRSKAGCLRICQQGPIALVYPEGVWYRLVDQAACQRIVEEHLIGGRVVRELVIAEHPLPPSSLNSLDLLDTTS